MTARIPRNVIIFVCLLVLIALASYFGYQSILKNRSVRQAVFLTSGQVYFGMLGSTSGDFIELKDVYYLPSQDKLQDGNQDKKKLSIIKLGEEVHGPEDSIFLNKQHVVLYENMKSSSKINEAIKTYINERSKKTTASPTPQASTEPTPTTSPTS
jgi:hypothetical protein